MNQRNTHDAFPPFRMFGNLYFVGTEPASSHLIDTGDGLILLEDGDTFTLGNTTITCMATPGHTPGAMSYFFPVTDGVRTYRAALHGGMGVNTMCRDYLDKYGLSYTCRQKFADAMDRLAAERVDIFLGNHMQHNHTARKYQKVTVGDADACIDPAEWAAYALWAKEKLLRMIRKENGEA